MKKLGYYAKDKDGNLFKFKWASDDTLYIFKCGKPYIGDPKDYEILEIGFFTADSE